MEYELVEASIRKTCDLKGRWTGLTPECLHTGYILRRPRAGRRLVIFCDSRGDGVHRHDSVATAPVTRIARGLFDNEMFLETENSVYRLVLGRAILGCAAPSIDMGDLPALPLAA